MIILLQMEIKNKEKILKKNIKPIKTNEEIEIILISKYKQK